MTSDQEHRLLVLARRTIVEALRTGHPRTPTPDQLDEDLRDPGAAFVTLRTASTGELRGCVGSLEATRPLGQDVAAHALDAAFHDPRFPALTDAADLLIDISVLGPLREFPAADYADLAARVPVGAGVFVVAPGHRATYLPSVWQELPGPEMFLAYLWQKAGLFPGAWPAGIKVFTYEVSEFSEPSNSQGS